MHHCAQGRREKRRRKCLAENCQGSIWQSYYMGRREKKYEQEYWKKLEENWRRWKKNPFAKISHNPFLWMKQQEDDEMGNIGDWDSEL